MRKIAVFLSAVLIVLLAAPPAFADPTVVRQGDDRAWVYSDTPDRIWVSDEECDGNPVRAKYWIKQFGTEYGPYFLRDEDGCGGSWWYADWGSSGEAAYLISRLEVCERQNDGDWVCGEQKSTHLHARGHKLD